MVTVIRGHNIIYGIPDKTRYRKKYIEAFHRSFQLAGDTQCSTGTLIDPAIPDQDDRLCPLAGVGQFAKFLFRQFPRSGAKRNRASGSRLIIKLTERLQRLQTPSNRINGLDGIGSFMLKAKVRRSSGIKAGEVTNKEADKYGRQRE